jgi:glutamate-1-semialdehyde aminotransferase
MTAGIETLRLLKKPGVYKTLEKNSKALNDGLKKEFKKAG